MRDHSIENSESVREKKRGTAGVTIVSTDVQKTLRVNCNEIYPSELFARFGNSLSS